MSYAHNMEADFAAVELANLFVANPKICYSSTQKPPAISATAAYEPPSSGWPEADGLIAVLEGGGVERAIAIEYKRRQEGIHGILTAMGQAQGYIHKGYNGVVIVVPRTYLTHSDPWVGVEFGAAESVVKIFPFWISATTLQDLVGDLLERVERE